MVFAVWLKVLPIGLSVPIGVEASGVTLGDRIVHAILPALTLSITGISNIAMHTREKMGAGNGQRLHSVRQSQGGFQMDHDPPPWPAQYHLPAMTLQFASISEIFGGSVLVEQVFSYPGLGQAAVTAGLGGDIPLLLGITVISAAIVFAGNFTANPACTAWWTQEFGAGGRGHEAVDGAGK